MELSLNGKYLKIMPKKVSAETRDIYKLSKEQLNFYEENGFLVIKNLIDFDSLYIFRKRFLDIAKGQVEVGFMAVIEEKALVAKGAKGEDALNKLQDIHFDDVFSMYTEHPRLLDVVSQLIGDNITAVHSMLINKPPGTGRHPPHQDMYYFPFRPADKIVASWTAMDHVDLDNGCLYVIPKSHKQYELIAHSTPVDSCKLYHGIHDESVTAPVHKRVHLEMSPGDTVFFHPLLIHGSGPNVSKKYRKAISCHYASGECHYVSVDGTVQEAVAKEIEEVIRKRNLPSTYVDTWRFKNKLVRGVKSNL